MYNNLAYPYIISSLMTTEYQSGIGFLDAGSSGNVYGKKSTNGRTLYWYSDANSNYQFNRSDHEYYYIAFA